MRRLGQFGIATLIVLIMGGSALSGCFRAYDRPEYVEVDTAET